MIRVDLFMKVLVAPTTSFFRRNPLVEVDKAILARVVHCRSTEECGFLLLLLFIIIMASIIADVDLSSCLMMSLLMMSMLIAVWIDDHRDNVLISCRTLVIINDERRNAFCFLNTLRSHDALHMRRAVVHSDLRRRALREGRGGRTRR